MKAEREKEGEEEGREWAFESLRVKRISKIYMKEMVLEIDGRWQVGFL